MLDINFFQSLANYANKAWKGGFTKEEVRENAETYLSDFNYSNEHGECSESIKTLIRNIIEDAENGNWEVLVYAQCMIDNAIGWIFNRFYCSGADGKECNYHEVVFFSKTEIENLAKCASGEMPIQDAIPTKSPMVREFFVSGRCMCPKCWGKMWLAENLDDEE